ncbi:MAG: cysteine desulfurase NifS, partial [Syntrophales bacterium]|nr:cysteine desulfurase NifS [Syntrophales bacterium]
LSFKGIEADRLLEEIGPEVAASAGAACHAGKTAVSHVLEAMHVPLEWARGTLRFSVGRMSTEQEIDRAISAIAEAVIRLRN